MRGDQAVAEALAELVRDPLRHPPGVDEDDRGPVLVHVPRDEVDDLGHLLGGRDGAELVGRQLELQVKLAAMAGIDDRAARRAVGLRPAGSGADQQPGHDVDRALGRGQSDPLQRLTRHVREPFQRQGQVRAALVAGDRVDLVHDDGRARRRASPRGRSAVSSR